MDWGAISAIAQLVGIPVVVASLVYVARQLSQNTQMMRVAASSQWVDRDFEIVVPIIENREFAEVWAKGADEFDSLADVDKQRLLFFERRALLLWHHMYHMYLQNILPRANWNEQLWVIQNVGRRQAIRQAWGVYQSAFEPSFRNFIDEQFASSDRAAKAEQ